MKQVRLTCPKCGAVQTGPDPRGASTLYLNAWKAYVQGHRQLSPCGYDLDWTPFEDVAAKPPPHRRIVDRGTHYSLE